ncbi:hepatic and glial cell adhesion molecule [Mustelus asterias]
MLPSQRYLTSFIILLLGLLQGAFAPPILVTGFLHQPICLAAESKSHLSSVQTIRWQKGRQLIVLYQNNETESPAIFPRYKERVTYIAENNSLLIHQLNLQDEGEYKITTSLKAGPEKETFINLTVLVPVSEPSITVQTEDFPHPKLTMTCTVENGSNPQFSWMKDNKILLANLQFQLLTDNRSLAVTNLTSSHCGTYFCIVQNSVNRLQAQQLITSEHFQECLQPSTLRQNQVLVMALAVSCVVGFIAVFFSIKKFKAKRRELDLREQLSGEEDLFEETRGIRRYSPEAAEFLEENIQDEHSQTNMSSSREETQNCLYTYLDFIPSSGNQENVDPSQYCTIGPQL